jgi:hypothetical protein
MKKNRPEQERMNVLMGVREEKPEENKNISSFTSRDRI